MIVDLECTYCGKRWNLNNPSQYALNNIKCEDCGDRKIKMRNSTTDKIDYYKGSPPFPEKKSPPDWF